MCLLNSKCRASDEAGVGGVVRVMRVRVREWIRDIFENQLSVVARLFIIYKQKHYAVSNKVSNWFTPLKHQSETLSHPHYEL